ncbi:DUF362 domain-containing protein [Chloroflexota bacterium]
MASKVYYMDARSDSPQTSMVSKMVTVFEAAGFDSLIKPGDVVAIKLHCGEWNNTAYLRPVYARTLADKVKALGGRPFVCDTTTLNYATYAGRCTGLDFMVTAERNGYNSATLGCPFICADGFMGMDDYRVDLPEGYILKEAYIAEAIAAADVLITLTHFKGHAAGVIGGAIKNLGIGAQSKRGKFNVHMGGHPKYGFGATSIFHPENFKGRKGEKDWQMLEECCPFGLIHVTEDSIEWEMEKCVSCPSCLRPMLSHGIIELSEEHYKAVNAAIADACLATIKAMGPGKVAFINLAIDITRWCDCVLFSDVPILPDLGVFASYDPVAIDKACLDKAMETEGIRGSIAEEMDVLDCGKRKFEACSPLLTGLSEETQLNTGEIIGLGTRQHELVHVAEKKMEDVAFSPDPRPVGVRLPHLFAKLQPFPYDRYEGKGFLREEEVDLERVNTYCDGLK